MSRFGRDPPKDNFQAELTAIKERQRELESRFNIDRQEKEAKDDIEKWKLKSLREIEEYAEKSVKKLEALVRDMKKGFFDATETLKSAIGKAEKTGGRDSGKLVEFKQLLGQCETYSKSIIYVECSPGQPPMIPKIEVHMRNSGTMDASKSSVAGSASQTKNTDDSESYMDNNPQTRILKAGKEQVEQSKPTPGPAALQLPRSIAIGIEGMSRHPIQALFDDLCRLSPMNKTAMSGSCDKETTQMEEFLKREFGFRNIDGEKIVDGVKYFELKRPPERRNGSETIRFPHDKFPYFEMSIQDILKWQSSYAVYAPHERRDTITKAFLQRALRGGSGNGEEAFLMKFVIRISTCPILMEFDANVIPRRVGDDWPDRIKLVSVTGVDFACRKHDVSDVTTYIRNWKTIFQIDKQTKLPAAPNGRDLVLLDGAQAADLDKDLLYKDLVSMARARLRACDAQGVAIVIETGIGLGIFDGRYLGIDDQVRQFSALALHKVLKEDGAKYQNIKAVVFALPIFPTKSDPDGFDKSTYKAFVEEFTVTKYRGPIPVLIIDQDMHRLAVHIAKAGFQVSELNPADSHGVFGEYWQNRGPAVEEKLALTTLGLLVQHHLINRAVSDETRYHFI